MAPLMLLGSGLFFPPAVAPDGDAALLLETGDGLLLETGDALLLEA